MTYHMTGLKGMEKSTIKMFIKGKKTKSSRGGVLRWGNGWRLYRIDSWTTKIMIT